MIVISIFEKRILEFFKLRFMLLFCNNFFSIIAVDICRKNK